MPFGVYQQRDVVSLFENTFTDCTAGKGKHHDDERIPLQALHAAA